MKKSDNTNADSFGTFLDNINVGQASPAPASGAPLKLLRSLAVSGPQSVPDLLTASGVAFSDFTRALNNMKEAGLVTIADASGAEKVALTASGEQVARMES